MADPLTHLSFRLPSALVAEIDRAVGLMASAPGLRIGVGREPSRADVLRAALERGLPELIAELEAAQKGGKPARKPR
jgi:Arc/MetJ-type ribon-helix-helix transcriptional regulator